MLYTEKRFSSENFFDVIAYYDKDVNRVEDIVNACEVLDHILSHPGVLASEQIVTLMKLGILIFDGTEKRVKGASYDLLIDKEHLQSGIKVVSSDTFTISPLDYIVASAKESVNLPKNICGTFDTKVSMFCKGIILSNGPQVDPGYQGRLLCLLFNTSAKEFIIEQSREFEFATIQFSALSKKTDIVYSGRYQRKERVRDYISQFADQSIGELVKNIPEIRNKLDQIETELRGLRKKRFSWGHIIVTALITILVAGISGAFFMGSLYKQIANQEKRIENLEAKTGSPKNESISLKNSNIINQNKLKNQEVKKSGRGMASNPSGPSAKP
jgi:deoxycytidine triphosphate deaminase